MLCTSPFSSGSFVRWITCSSDYQYADNNAGDAYVMHTSLECLRTGYNVKCQHIVPACSKHVGLRSAFDRLTTLCWTGCLLNTVCFAGFYNWTIRPICSLLSFVVTLEFSQTLENGTKRHCMFKTAFRPTVVCLHEHLLRWADQSILAMQAVNYICTTLLVLRLAEFVNHVDGSRANAAKLVLGLSCMRTCSRLLGFGKPSFLTFLLHWTVSHSMSSEHCTAPLWWL